MNKRFYPFLPTITSALLAVVLFPFLLTPDASARVGENRTSLENRLLQREIGVAYQEDQINHFSRRAPYHNLLSLPREDGRTFYEAGEIVVYFKTDNPTDDRVRRPTGNNPPAGWNLHVFYVGGVSVMEYYHRTGSNLSEFERNSILALNRGNSTWKEVEEDDQTETAFGYQYEREDGALRAQTGRNHLLIFQTNLDKSIHARRSAQREHQRREAAASAPGSVTGF